VVSKALCIKLFLGPFYVLAKVRLVSFYKIHQKNITNWDLPKTIDFLLSHYRKTPNLLQLTSDNSKISHSTTSNNINRMVFL
jgi:hypothetical protein